MDGLFDYSIDHSLSFAVYFVQVRRYAARLLAGLVLVLVLLHVINVWLLCEAMIGFCPMEYSYYTADSRGRFYCWLSEIRSIYLCIFDGKRVPTRNHSFCVLSSYFESQLIHQRKSRMCLLPFLLIIWGVILYFIEKLKIKNKCSILLFARCKKCVFKILFLILKLIECFLLVINILYIFVDFGQ